MIRTQISMTEAQADALRRLAAARGISQAAVMRDLLDELVERDIRSRRIESVRRSFGAFASGHSDTSVNHDEVLAEIYADR
jgi:hypothetical protein